MKTVYLPSSCPEELHGAIARLTQSGRIAQVSEKTPDTLALSFEKSTTGQACADLAPDGTLIIRYHTITQAMRLLGDALAGTLRPGAVCQTPFRTLGIMIDCSRCAVPRTETVFSTIERLALLGYNRLLLDTEDVYTLPGEPYFGLQRGRYTAEEIRAFDDCAADFGVELVPCFQTLAHLDQMFGWPHYSDIRDLTGVMLVGEEKVYALIEKMMQFWTQNVRTRTFHIGMDEAWGIGTGEYRKRYGEKPAFDILLDHIARVSEICDRYGVKPIMWSDMWFRAASPKGDYYDPCEIPAAVAEKIPENLQLCCWDYCHTDKAFYIDYIRRLQALHGEPSLAASIWTSNLLWFASTHTMARLIPCMEAVMETGLQALFSANGAMTAGSAISRVPFPANSTRQTSRTAHPPTRRRSKSAMRCFATALPLRRSLPWATSAPGIATGCSTMTRS